MDTVDVTITMPHNILGALDVPDSDLTQWVHQLVALELFREGRISAGKAAEILGIRKYEFIHLLAQYEIPYFNQTPEELAADVAALEALVEQKRPWTKVRAIGRKLTAVNWGDQIQLAKANFGMIARTLVQGGCSPRQNQYTFQRLIVSTERENNG